MIKHQTHISTFSRKIEPIQQQQEKMAAKLYIR